jgi:hypothetical protein
MPGTMEHEPHGKQQSRKAAASGWIGSALEYYRKTLLQRPLQPSEQLAFSWCAIFHPEDDL